MSSFQLKNDWIRKERGKCNSYSWRKKQSVETDSKWALDAGFGKDLK